MAQRLPLVNGDDGAWGTLLVQFLTKEHYQDAATSADFASNGSHKNINIFPGTVSAAPITFTSTFTSSGGTTTNAALLSTAANGAMEYDGTFFYLTTGGARKKIAILNDASGATGDTYYRDASGNFVRLPAGSANTLLTSAGAGTAPAWTATYAAAPTAGTITTWDTNKNLSANAFFRNLTSTATSTTTYTMTAGSTETQQFTGSTAQTVTLPTTSVPAGAQWRLLNNSTAALTVNASGGATVTVLAPNTDGLFVALIATPAAATDWEPQYFGTATANGKVLTISNSLTLAGTDATTMTFPGASDTVATVNAVQTLASKTLTAPVLNSPTTTSEVLNSGTASAPPLKMTAGTNLTTAAAGAIEYDGTLFYATAAASTRQVLHAEQMTTLTATYTLINQTAAQKLFNATTNGAVTLQVGSYFFDCFFTLSNMSATSGSFGWTLAPGGATIASILWQSEANKATLATAASAQNTTNTAANTAIVTATTSQVGWAHVWGKVRISAAGTVIPQVSLGVANAAVVGTDSFFRIWSIGSSTTTYTGNWS